MLRDSETGRVRKTGRSNDLARRQKELARDPRYRDFDFEPVHHTDDYAEQRGLEQVLNDSFKAPLDRIRRVDPRRRAFAEKYAAAAQQHIDRLNGAGQ